MYHLRIAIAVVLLLAGTPAAHAVITALYPLRVVLADSPYIVTAQVELVDAGKPAAIFTIEEDLKGKFPVRRLLVNLTGDSEAKKDDHTAKLLKRLGPN